jgi:hypothetical protein
MEELILTEEQIEKLPIDARKDYRKYYLMLHEKKNKAEIHSDFLKFVKTVWPDFVEGSHHKKIADQFNSCSIIMGAHRVSSNPTRQSTCMATVLEVIRIRISESIFVSSEMECSMDAKSYSRRRFNH